jgi:CheY-like chemotaxis protein/predicted regulator of Ras-like GTPase activity (Roadblock/LC7/MglB family)
MSTMKTPRILVVDEGHEVVRILRSNLELSGRACSVIDVHSGEEALIELTRGPVHLLITDLGLPGISGHEVLQRYKQLHPHARSIVITGQPTQELQAKAEELGIVALFKKPIGTNYFLEAVDRALEAFTGEDDADELQKGQTQVEDILRQVLHTLSADLTLLINANGEIIARSGESEIPDLETTLISMTNAFNAGQKTSALLGSSYPGSIQYFDGDTHDLYLASVGTTHALVIILRSGQETIKMGAIVHYGKRAAAALLAHFAPGGTSPSSPEHASARHALEWREFKVDETHPGAKDESKDWTGSKLKAKSDEALKDGAEMYWRKMADDTSEFTVDDEDILTFREARERGLMTNDPETLN